MIAVAGGRGGGGGGAEGTPAGLVGAAGLSVAVHGVTDPGDCLPGPLHS